MADLILTELRYLVFTKKTENDINPDELSDGILWKIDGLINPEFAHKIEYTDKLQYVFSILISNIPPSLKYNILRRSYRKLTNLMGFNSFDRFLKTTEELEGNTAENFHSLEINEQIKLIHWITEKIVNLRLDELKPIRDLNDLLKISQIINDLTSEVDTSSIYFVKEPENTSVDRLMQREFTEKFGDTLVEILMTREKSNLDSLGIHESLLRRYLQNHVHVKIKQIPDPFHGY